jgi:hypothetical protein
MLARLGREHRAVNTPRGTLSIWLPRPGLLVTEAIGHITAAQTHAIIAAGDEIRGEGTLLAFHNFFGVQTYDSAARTAMTAWGYRIRASVEHVHFAIGSRLVRMGISVASMALGGMLVTYDELAPFERELEDALTRPRVRG